MTIVPTDRPPQQDSIQVTHKPSLMVSEEHHLCPGCGHPVAWRILFDVIAELGLEKRAIGMIGHGCYTIAATLFDVEWLQTLHGRAPAVATGVKRVRPEAVVFTVQGDGDCATEGLHEIMHAASRGEAITCIMLNNGVFGDTGGQMTSTTVVGQRTKTSLEGRDPKAHGYPIPLADILALLPGAAFVARGAVNNAGAIAQTKRYLTEAFETQSEGGFAFVEILTMCPTGWFLPTNQGPDYLTGTFENTFPTGQLKPVRSA